MAINVRCLPNVREIKKKQIGTPDLMIFFTGAVAHKMVNVAVEQAERVNAAVEHCRSGSVTALADILENYADH